MNKKRWNIKTKLVPIILGLALILTEGFSLISIRNLQGNARVINYTGIVRGATQRLIKKELNRVPDDELIGQLDSILYELSQGVGEYQLVKMKDPEFQNLISEMQNHWSLLKEEIVKYRDGGDSSSLFEQSEEYFTLANETVSAAESYAEDRVYAAERAMIFMTLAFSILAVIGGLYVSCQQKKQEHLKAAEEENRIKSEQLSRQIKELLVPMNEISELLYIADTQTYELLFMNNAGKRMFRVDDVKGKMCYEVLQGLKEPCPFCTTQYLVGDDIYTWERRNPITGRHYLLKDRLVEWDGRPARLEIAFDMTEAENEKVKLQGMLDSEKVIVQCIRQLYQNADIEEATNDMLRQIGTSLEAEHCYIYALGKDCMINTFEWIRDGVKVQRGYLHKIPFTAYDGLLKPLEKLEYIAVADLEEVKDHSLAVYTYLQQQDIRRFVLVPLEKDGKMAGYMGIDNIPESRMNNAVTIMETLRYYLMLARRRAEDQEKLAKLSYYDNLTMFYNRNRYIQDIEKMAKQDLSVGVVFLDINGLKEINDSQGHAAGDHILKVCAGKIQAAFQEGAFYRIGGDEFVIVCPGIVKEKFEECVAQLRESFIKDRSCKAAIGSKWSECCKDILKVIVEADGLMYTDKKEFYRSHNSTRRYRYHNED